MLTHAFESLLSYSFFRMANRTQQLALFKFCYEYVFAILFVAADLKLLCSRIDVIELQITRVTTDCTLPTKKPNHFSAALMSCARHVFTHVFIAVGHFGAP